MSGNPLGKKPLVEKPQSLLSCHLYFIPLTGIWVISLTDILSFKYPLNSEYMKNYQKINVFISFQDTLVSDILT